MSLKREELNPESLDYKAKTSTRSQAAMVTNRISKIILDSRLNSKIKIVKPKIKWGERLRRTKIKFGYRERRIEWSGVLFFWEVKGTAEDDDGGDR